MEIDTHPTPDPREVAYEAVLADAQRRPFAWGVHDCCTFAAAVVQARTGRDVLAGLAWDSTITAARLVQAEGGLRQAVAERLGEPVAAPYACTGDIVLAVDPEDTEHRHTLAVMHGGMLIGPGKHGLAIIPASAGIVAWRLHG